MNLQIYQANPAMQTTSAASSFGVSSTVSAVPLDRKVEMISVFVDELEDMKSGSNEEFRQFALGQFVFSGAFWLGLERAFTASSFWEDRLFQFCVILVAAGGVVAFFGWRQLQRRRSKIDRIICSAKSRPTGTASVPGSFGATLAAE